MRGYIIFILLAVAFSLSVGVLVTSCTKIIAVVAVAEHEAKQAAATEPNEQMKESIRNANAIARTNRDLDDIEAMIDELLVRTAPITITTEVTQ